MRYFELQILIRWALFEADKNTCDEFCIKVALLLGNPKTA